MPDLKAYFESKLEEMIALLVELCEIESPTTDKAAVDRMAWRVAEELESLGADLIWHPREVVGDIIEAHWHADAPGKPLLFVCHMDTVHPIGMLARLPIRREGDKLYGPGTYDEKGGIVAMLAALRGLQDMDVFPKRPMIALMTTDEETGSEHSRPLIEKHAREAALTLVMESCLPDGATKTQRKGIGNFSVRTYGVSAHAGGAHEAGVNAIEEMAHQILALQALTDYKVGRTVSVNLISGGTRTNVIPDSCEAIVDARALTHDAMDRLGADILSLKPVLKGARVEISGSFDRPPLERNALMVETFTRAQSIGEKYGLSLFEGISGGGSDGNFTAAVGAATLDGIGPIGDGAHSENEFIFVDGLVTSATLLAGILLEWPTA
jgi:glutamate carboxypeptidase